MARLAVYVYVCECVMLCERVLQANSVKKIFLRVVRIECTRLVVVTCLCCVHIKLCVCFTIIIFKSSRS